MHFTLDCYISICVQILTLQLWATTPYNEFATFFVSVRDIWKQVQKSLPQCVRNVTHIRLLGPPLKVPYFQALTSLAARWQPGCFWQCPIMSVSPVSVSCTHMPETCRSPLLPNRKIIKVIYLWWPFKLKEHIWLLHFFDAPTRTGSQIRKQLAS